MNILLPSVVRRPQSTSWSCLIKVHLYRRANSTYTAWPQLEQIKSPLLAQFQIEAFRPSVPRHLVSAFQLPALNQWIDQSNASELNQRHFAPFQDSLYLPMELTTSMPVHRFARTTAPLAVFLEYLQRLHDSTPDASTPRMYIAQAPLQLLPDGLRREVPTPDLVLKAGKGDVYDSSLWIGPAFASRTPLHRDPNANILVQVAGTKAVRVLPPSTGQQIHRDQAAKPSAGASGTASHGTMRGEEMMGEEGRALDEIVWERKAIPENAFEAILHPGDGIFIPQGWWHSIRGMDRGINISVNWWFR